jgi:hypothetical protein
MPMEAIEGTPSEEELRRAYDGLPGFTYQQRSDSEGLFAAVQSKLELQTTAAALYNIEAVTEDLQRLQLEQEAAQNWDTELKQYAENRLGQDLGATRNESSQLTVWQALKLEEKRTKRATKTLNLAAVAERLSEAGRQQMASAMLE